MNRLLLTLTYFLFFSVLSAQDITTVEAKNQDISDNLDLEAIAYIFGESLDLEDFEARLNDPEERISNLDLNQDGYVDYLRVIETAVENAHLINAHLITIQAVLGEDFYQDVATIDVERDSSNNTRVQVIGDVYLYGDDYIIEPIYAVNPVICEWFWSLLWRIWVSPWRHGHCPPYHVFWRPCSYYDYYTHVHTHCIGSYHSLNYVSVRRSNACVQAQRETRRNDLEIEQPNTDFAARQPYVTNKYDLDQQRGINRERKLTKIDAPPATGKKVKQDWKTQAEKEGKSSIVKDKKVTVTTRENAVTKERSRPSSTRPYNDKPVNTTPKPERTTVNKTPKKETQPSRQYNAPKAAPQSKPAPRSKPTPRSTPTPRSKPEVGSKPAPPSKPAKVNSTKPKTSPPPQKTKVAKSTKTPTSKSGKKR